MLRNERKKSYIILGFIEAQKEGQSECQLFGW